MWVCYNRFAENECFLSQQTLGFIYKFRKS